MSQDFDVVEWLVLVRRCSWEWHKAYGARDNANDGDTDVNG